MGLVGDELTVEHSDVQGGGQESHISLKYAQKITHFTIYLNSIHS